MTSGSQDMHGITQPRVLLFDNTHTCKVKIYTTSTSFQGPRDELKRDFLIQPSSEGFANLIAVQWEVVRDRQRRKEGREGTRRDGLAGSIADLVGLGE